jgi:hypothetical protein
MDKVQKHNSFNTNTQSSESYRNYLCADFVFYLERKDAADGPVNLAAIFLLNSS